MNLNEVFEPISKVYQSRSGYNYTFLFAFEKKCFMDDVIKLKKAWMSDYFPFVIFYGAAYLAFIAFARKFTEKREKFVLRRFLIAWNLLLSCFSAMGAIRVWPEFIYEINKRGLEYTFCNHDWTHGVQGCWCHLFVLSKFAEFIDTFFIVARKQKLIFLHWYHHVTVLLYVWFSSLEVDSSAAGRWFMAMNFTVHAFMYGYYAFSALRFKIPKWVNIALTSAQILQMVIGIYINFNAFLIKQRGGQCAISDNNLKFSFVMYSSYFLLFFNFFYQVYIAPKFNESGKSARLVDSTESRLNTRVKVNGSSMKKKL